MKAAITKLVHRVGLKKSLVLAASFFVVAISSLFIIASRPVAAAEPGGCVGNGFTTGFKSSFTGACVGDSGSTAFIEFAVRFSNPVANARVTFTNGNNNTNNSPGEFRKINDTTYALQPDGRGMGYQTVGNSASCTSTRDNPVNKITIKVEANGQSESIGPIDLCTEMLAKNWTVSRNSNLRGDSGQGSGKGRIVGTFTTTRPGAPDGDPRKTGTAEKQGVISIKLVKQGGPTLEGNNAAGWYSLVDGRLSIPDLDPGTYDLTINYNDRATAQIDNIIPDWANPNITVTANGIKVEAGKDTSISLTGGTQENQQGEGEEGPKCTTGAGLAGALSYLLCPTMALIINATEFVEKNIIIPYLTITPLSTAGDNAIYKLWQNMRNIANIAFIIAFFFVIFSQATSVGLSNYGIKRILPRLAIVAIGTNLSYFIVAFAIDAFNIFGAGIAQLVMAAINTGGGGGGGASPDPFATLLTVTAVAGGVTLAILLTTASQVLGWIMGLIGIAFLILMVAVIVLVLRQMIIILLVVVSPLAFVAWLLPNTERYFTRWRGMLLQLLMMYPFIVLLFAVGKIVSALITSGTFEIGGAVAQLTVGNLLEGLGLGYFAATATGAIADGIKVGIGFFANVAPLIFLPAAFMWSSKMLGGIFNAIRQRGQKGAKATKDWAKGAAKPYTDRAAVNLANRGGIVGRIAGRGLRKDFKKQQRERELQRAQNAYLADYAGGNARFRRSAAGVGGEAGANRVLAQAQSTITKLESEELENAMSLLTRQLKDLGVDQKSFASGLGKYLKDPTRNDVLRDNNGNVIRDANGRSFNFSQHPELMKAALHSAAAQGEVGVMEAARMAAPDVVNQRDVDAAISKNDGTLKGKGGYHLATNFELATGRSQGGQEAMQVARLTAFAQSSAEDIANMKVGHVATVANEMPQAVAALQRQEAAAATAWSAATTPDARDAAQKQLDNIANIRIGLAKNIDVLKTNPNIQPKITDRDKILKNMEAGVRGPGNFIP